MRDTIFYSWQSDLPQNRNLIQKALEDAVVAIHAAHPLRVEPAVDRALKGAAGAVRIDHDILARIDACGAFVGDVTLVTAEDPEKRRSPNPNVLIELGYALKGLGWERIVLPFNEACGDKEDLPFDLEKNRLLLFRLPTESNSTVRKAVHQELVADFGKALEAIVRIPVLKDDVIKFLDEINPEICRRVRAGRPRFVVNLAMHRLERLQALLGTPAANELVEITPTGASAFGAPAGVATEQGVYDVFGGSVIGFLFTFKGDSATW